MVSPPKSDSSAARGDCRYPSRLPRPGQCPRPQSACSHSRCPFSPKGPSLTIFRFPLTVLPPSASGCPGPGDPVLPRAGDQVLACDRDRRRGVVKRPLSVQIPKSWKTAAAAIFSTSPRPPTIATHKFTTQCASAGRRSLQRYCLARMPHDYATPIRPLSQRWMASFAVLSSRCLPESR